MPCPSSSAAPAARCRRPAPGRAATPCASSPARSWSAIPVIFVTDVVALRRHPAAAARRHDRPAALAFTGQIAAWLWFTVLFANFAEAVAEGRGKAQADALRRTRSDTRAKLLLHPDDPDDDLWEPRPRLCARDRRRRAGRGGRHHPGRRRDHRRHRVGQRIGHHRRVGARHPRIRRRPLGRHRRHGGALRLDQGAHHRRRRARPSSTG